MTQEAQDVLDALVEFKNQEVNATLTDIQNFELHFDALVYYALIFVSFTLVVYLYRKVKEQIK